MNLELEALYNDETETVVWDETRSVPFDRLGYTVEERVEFAQRAHRALDAFHESTGCTAGDMKLVDREGVHFTVGEPLPPDGASTDQQRLRILLADACPDLAILWRGAAPPFGPPAGAVDDSVADEVVDSSYKNANDAPVT